MTPDEYPKLGAHFSWGAPLSIERILIQLAGTAGETRKVTYSRESDEHLEHCQDIIQINPCSF